MKIRQLGSADLSAMRAMLAMFGTAFEDQVAYMAAQPEDNYLARLLGQSNFIALAAFDGTDVIGGLAAYELTKFEQARSEIYIYDLAVAARYRRQGVATGLIDELREIAAERGAWMIFVQADHGDDPAVALYTKVGRREDVLHFDIVPAAG